MCRLEFTLIDTNIFNDLKRYALALHLGLHNHYLDQETFYKEFFLIELQVPVKLSTYMEDYQGYTS